MIYVQSHIPYTCSAGCGSGCLQVIKNILLKGKTGRHFATDKGVSSVLLKKVH